METITLDNLETEHGTAILSQLCGESLTRNQQPTRLFDQTRNSAELFFRADQQGKPYVQDFQNGKRWYAITAYMKAYGLDFNTAKANLLQQYYENSLQEQPTYRPIRVELLKPVDYLPTELYQPCRNHFERNGLYEYLCFTYGSKAASEAFSRYRLGTSRRWRYSGYLSTCLPQFDINGNLRQVKIMPFDAMNGRRVKKHQPAELWNLKIKQYEPTTPDTDKIYFAGKQLAKQAGRNDVTLKQCFFGEHLLAEYPEQAVAIVEGESTAIVCSILWPEYVWLATGGSVGGSWSSAERFSVLAGRHVTLWPDTGKYADWSQKANAIRPLVQSLNVSDYVEKNAPAGVSNVDLRDLLTQPCYFPKGESKPIYGEVLAVESCGTYPAEWDQPTGRPALIFTRSTNQPLISVLAQCLNLSADTVPLFQFFN